MPRTAWVTTVVTKAEATPEVKSQAPSLAAPPPQGAAWAAWAALAEATGWGAALSPMHPAASTPFDGSWRCQRSCCHPCSWLSASRAGARGATAPSVLSKSLERPPRLLPRQAVRLVLPPPPLLSGILHLACTGVEFPRRCWGAALSPCSGHAPSRPPPPSWPPPFRLFL